MPAGWGTPQGTPRGSKKIKYLGERHPLVVAGGAVGGHSARAQAVAVTEALNGRLPNV